MTESNKLMNLVKKFTEEHFMSSSKQDSEASNLAYLSEEGLPNQYIQLIPDLPVTNQHIQSKMYEKSNFRSKKCLFVLKK